MKNRQLFQTASRRTFLLIMFCWMQLYGMAIFAQTKIVTGQVIDVTHSPLPGVNILVKGTTIGCITDIDGNYSISVPDLEADILVFSYIGFTQKEVACKGQPKINVTLTEDQQQLDEVVVVGYGVQKKSHLTGSISKIKNENLGQLPVSRADQALVGKLAGVQIQNVSAQSGASPKIQIRGIGSISADTNPLIVVDGYPIPGDLSDVDMNDVESIEVLKDAASAAIYGSRGANGIIIVTTRSGSSEGSKPTIRINSYGGVKERLLKGIQRTRPEDWKIKAEQIYAEMGRPTSGAHASMVDDMKKVYVASDVLGTQTDWVEETIKLGYIQNHQISVSGGSKNVNYYASGSFLDEKGIVITDRYKKFNLNAKVDAKINDKLEFGVNVNAVVDSQRAYRSGSQSNINQVFRDAMYIPVRHTAETIEWARLSDPTLNIGDYAHEYHFSKVPYNGEYISVKNAGVNNGISTTLERNDRTGYIKALGNIYLQYQPVKGLILKSSFGGYASMMDYKFYQSSLAHNNGKTSGQYKTAKVIDWLNENIATYTPNLGENHSLSILAGYTVQKTTGYNSNMTASDFPTDNIQTLNAGIINSGNTTEYEELLLSALGRVTYSYKGKYLASVSSRWDGSSRFGINNKWGYFPSVSLGWRISEESFFTPVKKIIDELKIRASFGASGNKNIGNYQAFGLLSQSNAVINNKVTPGYTQISSENKDLGWERTYQYNGGFDLGMFNNRLRINLDAYYTITDKLLLEREISSMTGQTNQLVNMGKMSNTGYEIEITTQNIQTKDFSWSTSLNIAQNFNKVLNLGGVDKIISSPKGEEKRPTYFVTEVGKPLVQFYGFVVEKEIPNEGLISPVWPVDVKPELVHVKDLDGNGKIDDDDMVAQGSPYPKVTWGMTNDLKWKDFDLNVVVQGSHGNKVFNIDEHYAQSQWNGKLLPEYQNSYNNIKHKASACWFIEDASFIAIRSINLGYTLPKNIMKNCSLRVYASIYNPCYFLLGDYKGYNPEGIKSFDTPLIDGYQSGAMPLARTYTLGFNFQF